MIDESKEICIICFGVKEKASMEFMLTPHHREPQLVCMNCYNNNEHVNKIQKNLLKTAIYYNEMTWYNLLVEIQKKMNNRTREYSYTILRILDLVEKNKNDTIFKRIMLDKVLEENNINTLQQTDIDYGFRKLMKV